MLSLGFKLEVSELAGTTSPGCVLCEMGDALYIFCYGGFQSIELKNVAVENKWIVVKQLEASLSYKIHNHHVNETATPRGLSEVYV